MSMTRGEAIAELQACVDAWDRWVPANGSMADKNTQAVKMALSALRPVSREQVERLEHPRTDSDRGGDGDAA